jgi:hypothetical protein
MEYWSDSWCSYKESLWLMVPASILFGASRLVSTVHGVKNVPLPKCNLSESLIFELGLILFHLLTVINTLCSWVRSFWLICWNIPIAITCLIFWFKIRSQLVQFHITCLVTCNCPCASAALRLYRWKFAMNCFPAPCMKLAYAYTACINLFIVNHLICFIISPQATELCS